jgi:DNA-binding response OmpR family regulator
MQVHIRRMRSKLKAAGNRSPTIASVRGLGYRLIWEGTPTGPAPAGS